MFGVQTISTACVCHMMLTGVVDLDLSITPDAFGLRAFDVAKPLTRMLPGQFANELRLMIPDLGIAPQGFHDIVIEDLAATPTWWSRRLLSGDVTSLRRRWPKALFHHAETFDGYGAAPPGFSQPAGVGISAQSAGLLLPVSGTDYDRLG